MNREDIYKLLEDKMLGYEDYLDVPTIDNNEKLVVIRNTKNLKRGKIGHELASELHRSIFLRADAKKRLHKAAKLLGEFDESLCLEIVYGHRSIKVQEKLYEEFKNKLSGTYSGKQLIAETHRKIALPSVAGHPTGGAIDIHITRNGTPINMGTKIWEFKKDSFTFSPFIDTEAWSNRQLLRTIMLQVGFAPFDGEWWHFSYGDKEWAKYYHKPNALYDSREVAV